MPSDSGAAWTPPAGAGAGERRLSNSSDGSACSGYSKACEFEAANAHRHRCDDNVRDRRLDVLSAAQSNRFTWNFSWSTHWSILPRSGSNPVPPNPDVDVNVLANTLTSTSSPVDVPSGGGPEVGLSNGGPGERLARAGAPAV